MKKVLLKLVSIFFFFICTLHFISCTSIPAEKGEFVVSSNGDIIYQQDYYKQILWESLGYDWLHLKSSSDNKVYTIESDIYISWDDIHIHNDMLLYSYFKEYGDTNFLTLYDVNKKKKIKTFYFRDYPESNWDEINNNFYVEAEEGIIEYNNRGKKIRYIIKYPSRFLPDKDRYRLYDARNNELLLRTKNKQTGNDTLYLLNTENMQMQSLYEIEKENGIMNACLSNDLIIWIKFKWGGNDYCLESYDRKTGDIKTLYEAVSEHDIEDLTVINNYAFFKDDDDFRNDDDIIQFNLLSGEKKNIGQGNYFTDGQYIWIEKKDSDGSSQIIKEEVY